MKKTIVALMMMVTLGVTSVFAGGEKVSPAVLSAFNSEFASAQEVSWFVAGDYYKAAFTFNGQRVFAYYDENAELLGVTRYISTTQLPLSLMKDIKSRITADIWVSGLVEVSSGTGTTYFITLEDADSKTILKSSNGGNWTVHEKNKKA